MIEYPPGFGLEDKVKVFFHDVLYIIFAQENPSFLHVKLWQPGVYAGILRVCGGGDG